MKKRDLLTRSAVLALLPTDSALAAGRPGAGPTLLTLSGALGRTNRGPFDPVLDQMMARHGLQFNQAFAFDAAALQRLAAVSIRPTLEYDARVHTLTGPLLASVLEAAGIGPGRALQLGLRAVDGYNVALSLSDALSYRMIIATHIDGQPLALGGLGPQWAVYDADRVVPFKDKPLKERFALCPWGLYHVDVKLA